MLKCDICARSFKTKSGLGSHMRAKHPSIRPSAAQDGSSAEPIPAEVGERFMGGPGSDGGILAEACDALKIEAKNVMAFKIYEDRVVIIEGPVGHKRVYERR